MYGSATNGAITFCLECREHFDNYTEVRLSRLRLHCTALHCTALHCSASQFFGSQSQQAYISSKNRMNCTSHAKNSQNISPQTYLDIIRKRNGCAEVYICLSYHVSCQFQTSEGIIHSFLPPSTPSSKNYVGGNKNMLYLGRIMKFFPNWPKLPQSQLAQLRSLREKGELKEIHSQVTLVALGQNWTRGEKFGSANFA